MMADPDGSQKIIDINQPFEDKATGKTKIYQFSDDTIRYHVTIGTGPTYPARRAQQTDAILQLGQTVPGALPPVLDLIAQYLDLPDSFAARWRPPNIPKEGAEEGPSVQQMQQVMAQQADLIQKLTGTVQGLSDDIKNKRLELESKERIALHGDETQQIVAAMKVDTAKAIELMRQDFASIAHRLDLLHENTGILASEQSAQAASQPPSGVSPAGGGSAPAEGAP